MRDNATIQMREKRGEENNVKCQSSAKVGVLSTEVLLYQQGLDIKDTC